MFIARVIFYYGPSITVHPVGNSHPNKTLDKFEFLCLKLIMEASSGHTYKSIRQSGLSQGNIKPLTLKPSDFGMRPRDPTMTFYPYQVIHLLKT